MSIALKVYLGIVSVAGAMVLLRGKMLHLHALYEIYENFDDRRDHVTWVLTAIIHIVGVLRDTAKYILIALIVAAVSAPIYVWALARPRRWKTYSLLILGVAMNWVAAAPEETINDALSGDKHSIVAGTLVVIGLVYVITAAVQFGRGAGDLSFFLDDVEAGQERDRRRRALRESAAEMSSLQGQDREPFSNAGQLGQTIFRSLCALAVYDGRHVISALWTANEIEGTNTSLFDYDVRNKLETLVQRCDDRYGYSEDVDGQLDLLNRLITWVSNKYREKLSDAVATLPKNIYDESSLLDYLVYQSSAERKKEEAAARGPLLKRGWSQLRRLIGKPAATNR